MKTLLIVLLIITTPAHAFDNWQFAGNSMLFLDYLQTKEIARNPEFEEGNVFLGSDPSQTDVDIYFGSVFLLYNGLNYMLGNNEYRKTLNQAVTVFEGAVVIHNSFQGVKLRFKF